MTSVDSSVEETPAALATLSNTSGFFSIAFWKLSISVIPRLRPEIAFPVCALRLLISLLLANFPDSSNPLPEFIPAIKSAADVLPAAKNASNFPLRPLASPAADI